MQQLPYCIVPDYACSRYGTFLFLPLIGHCSLAEVSGKDSPALTASHTFSPFPHLLHQKDSPAPAALAAGVGHFFLPFPIQPHPLIPLFMARKRKPSLETFQSNITKKSTKCYVSCNAVSWFSNCSLMRLDSCTSVYDIIEPCSTVFILGSYPVWTPGRFGPIPVWSCCFGLILGVGQFGPILVGRFGPIFYTVLTDFLTE